MADFSHMPVISQGFHELVMEIDSIFIDFLQNMIPFHDFQYGQRDGAAHRIACVGMAVDESLMRAVIIIESIVHFIRGDGKRHGHVPCRQPF